MRRALLTAAVVTGLVVGAPAVASASPAAPTGLPGPGSYGCAWQLPDGRWVVDTACTAWGLRLRVRW